MNQHAEHRKNQPRPTFDEAKQLLEQRGWAVSAGSWEDEGPDGRVFVFSQESYRGTYGGAAAVVSWSQGWLSIPETKPSNHRFE